MMKPIRYLLLALLLVSGLLISRCSTGLSSADPAKAFVSAVFNGDAARARDQLCEQAKPLLDEAAVKAMADRLIDTTPLSYNVWDATETSANITVKGNVTVGSDDAKREVDFATLGGSLTLLPAVVENGAWKICPTSIRFGDESD